MPEPENTIRSFVKDANPDQMYSVINRFVKDFDWESYKARFPDTAAWNPLSHFFYHGHRKEEGRINIHLSLPGNPQPEPQPPSPGGWQPPTTPGMHEICRLDGPFGMSVCRVPDGLLIGTYRPAKLYHFDGTLREKLSLPVESIYMLQMFPDGLPGFTTECPAQAFKCLIEGAWDKWERVLHRDEPESCAFEFQPLGAEWVIQTVDRAWGNNTRLYKGSANGRDWVPWIDIPGKRLLNYGSDGNQIKLCGSTDLNSNGLPMICNKDGGDIHKREAAHRDNQYNYIIGANGIWNMGAQSITESRGHRNAYIDLFDGTNLLSVQDLTRPWTMDMQIAPNGDRYVVASAWKETDHATAELWRSVDNGWNWQPVCEIPMPAALAMHFADGGVYLVGGTYDKEMKVCFLKF